MAEATETSGGSPAAAVPSRLATTKAREAVLAQYVVMSDAVAWEGEGAHDDIEPIRRLHTGAYLALRGLARTARIPEHYVREAVAADLLRNPAGLHLLDETAAVEDRVAGLVAARIVLEPVGSLPVVLRPNDLGMLAPADWGARLQHQMSKHAPGGRDPELLQQGQQSTDHHRSLALAGGPEGVWTAQVLGAPDQLEVEAEDESPRRHWIGEVSTRSCSDR